MAVYLDGMMPVYPVKHFFLRFSGGGAGDAVPDRPLYAVMPFYFEGVVIPGAAGVVSARAAGSMHDAPGGVNPAREAFFRELGAARRFDPALVFSRRQMHSRVVVAVDGGAGRSRAGGAGADDAEEADGMVAGGAGSDGSGAALAVTVADCLAVFLYDTATGARALLHSGWKGTGIAVSALRLMAERYGTAAENVAALFGPCIQGRSYAVDEERARAFDAEFGKGGSFFRNIQPGGAPAEDGGFPLGPPVFHLPGAGGHAISLQAANARILAAAGVRNFSVCRNDTFTDTRLGSSRREGADRYTKMAAVFPPVSPPPRN